ncbi:MAG: hypothetical protein C4293_12505 [Nitrospiraceae bacterium]
MGRMGVRQWLLIVAFGCFSVWPNWFVGQPGVSGVALAADLNVEGLPKEPKAFRTQVEQILGKVDGLVAKLKGNASALPVVLDLIQTRDNIMREILKMEVTPDGAKWTLAEGRASVEAMLRLLRDQYEKASTMAG